MDNEDEMFKRYCELDSRFTDETHLRSWFRDQVLHPHETQHTLIEVNEWLSEINFSIQSCSINQYKPIRNYSIQSLGDMEKELELTSFKENVENLSFNPGYFTICAKKKIE